MRLTEKGKAPSDTRAGPSPRLTQGIKKKGEVNVALIIVTGAPAAGKSTWVKTVAKPGDIRFDGDHLTNTLTGKTAGKHNHDKQEKKISYAARQAGIREALKASRTRDVYIIHSNLNTDTLRPYRPYNPHIVIIDPGEELTLERCTKERPYYRKKQVEDWYANRSKWPKGAEVITDFTPGEDTETTPTQKGKATLHVVTGPPAAGKTTYVAEHAKPGDVRIDLDHLANTLAGTDVDNHEHAAHILTIAKAARQAAIDAAMKQDCAVWLIHTKPTPKQLDSYRDLGATTHKIDPGKDVVMKRCKTQRPKSSLIAAAKWYDTTATHRHLATRKKKPNFRERGYSYHDHELPRKRLLIALKDGTPCWWCGLPMHKDKAKNWDGKGLAADHSNPHGAKNGEKPDRLLHNRCNSQRQDGRYDKRRPALTGKHPSEPLAPQTGQQAPPSGRQGEVAAAFVWK